MGTARIPIRASPRSGICSRASPTPPSVVAGSRVGNITSGGDKNTTATSFVATVETATTAGSRLMLVYANNLTGCAITSITDPRGNTWAADASSSTTSNSGTGALWTVNVATPYQAGDAITVNHPSGGSSRAWNIDEYTGTATSTPTDGANTGTHISSATVNSGNIITTDADDVLIGYYMNRHDGTYLLTESTSFTTQVSDVGNANGGAATTNCHLHTADRAPGATGTYAYAATLTAARNGNQGIVAYKPVAVVATVIPNLVMAPYRPAR